jgi:hypothetical protein
MKSGTTPFRLTRHASQRMQQRGIKAETLDLLQQYGRRVYDHRGAARLIFDKQARQRIESVLGKAAAQVRYTAYAVVDAARGNTLITVAHRRNSRVREFA